MNTYEFIEGSLISAPARGIQEAFSEQKAYYSWLDVLLPSILKAVSDLADSLDSEGLFNRIMAFSQDGALATTLHG